MELANEENLIFNHKLIDYFYKLGIDIYSNGDIYRYFKDIDDWVLVPNNDNHDGYNRVRINNKRYRRHRLICACYKGLKLKYNKDNLIDHIDRNKLNNHVDNLRIVTNSQNGQNTNSKCYYFNKQHNKYEIRLMINGKLKYFGLYETEDEASKIAIEMKIKYYSHYNHIE